MPRDAVEFYNVAQGSERVGSASNASVYYHAAQGSARVFDANKNLAEYYNLNQLEDVLYTPSWFNTYEGEPIWIPGLMYNGEEFVRYKMYDGNMFRASYSASLEQVVYPNACTTGQVGGNLDISPPYATTLAVPAFPTGTTTAIAVVASTFMLDIATPSGWTLLHTQTVGRDPITSGASKIRNVSVFAIDNVVGDENRTFVFSNEVSDSYHVLTAAYTYFQNGGPGYWNVADTNTTVYTSTAYMAEVGSYHAPHIWWQVGMCTSLYTWSSGPSDTTPPSAGNNVLQSYSHPARGSSSGQNFHARWIGGVPHPDGTLVDWNSIGAAGEPNSASYALVWTPGERPV